jgi:ElaB/YqjD/DUF883 family membrane-anchored ribosome-binding protein
MNKAQIKKAVSKNLKIAVKKGDVLKKVALAKSGDLEKLAMKEIANIQKEMDSTTKKVQSYIKKNPHNAALISAGIGAALGTAAALLLTYTDKKSTKKRK